MEPVQPSPPHAAAEAAAPEDELARLACLTYGVDDPARWARARAIATPELPAGQSSPPRRPRDPAATAAILGTTGAPARRSGGPHGWEPILYLTYGRLGTGDPVEVLRLLLASGADPNAGFLWEGYPPPFTALTGVFGGGEGG